MSMQLSSTQEELVLKNQRLVYHLVNKLRRASSNCDYDDMVSEGTIGLIKAAATFDDSKKTKFSTYASRCIKNEILMYFRKENRHMYDISLNEPIAHDGKGNELTVGDKIPSPEKDFTERIEESEMFIKIISIILNLLEPRERLIMLYEIAGTPQKVIAENLNISQSYVARLEKKLNEEVKSYLTTTIQFKEVFKMDKKGDLYQISFVSKDVKHFSKIFATLLQNLTDTEELPDFKVECDRERIIILIPAYSKSFSFVAQIIQEIDNYSMTYVSKKNTLPANNTSSQKMKKNDTNESKEDEIGTIVKDSINTSSVEEPKEIAGNSDIEDGVSDSTEVETSSTAKRSSKSKQVRDYMLSMDSFTVKELKQHFPGLTAGVINNVLTQAKGKRLITSISRGEYKVTKK